MSDKQRILFTLTNHAELGDTGDPTGFFLSEAAHPYQVLRKAGFTIDFVSPEGGAVPIDPSSHDLDDEANAAFLDAEGDALQDTFAPIGVDPSDYAAIYFAGGHGTMWDFPDHDGLINLTSAIYEHGGVVGAVCHGPAGLVNVRLPDNSAYLVDGKQMTCFSDEEERSAELDDVVPFLLESKLKERGAHIETAEPFQQKVVIDGRLVTGQNPASATGVGQALADVIRQQSVMA